jgi:hypothetical protein
LDLETIYHAEGSNTAELESLSIKALLESNGIPTVLVGDPVFPNLPFEIKVPYDQAETARRLIADRKATGLSRRKHVHPSTSRR